MHIGRLAASRQLMVLLSRLTLQTAGDQELRGALGACS
jgi:hypothetical protein